jgi:NAD(P)-dependent dehydrogenase (short-subunit alcohol dehydrogenase family)/acyl carrier protein
MLDELVGALRAGSLRPLPLRVFDFAEAAHALRWMAQARHVGKLVLRAPLDQRSARDVPIDERATYLITGGLGALGLHTARWLVGRGARHLVLIARRGADTAAQRALNELAALGAHVDVHALDVADAAAMRVLLDDLRRTRPPLRGVVHAAGTLDDGVLMRQTAERFERVRRGKAVGAQVLDELTRELPLDFFVLYSAAGQLLGASGQAPYAAANAELDAIALARRAAGRPALSVAWGLWHGGGMATAMAAHGHDSWSSRGLRWIEPDAAFARLEVLLREGVATAAVLPIDWNRFLTTLPPGADPAYFERLKSAPAPSAAAAAAQPAAESRPQQWKRLPASQRRAALQAHLLDQALHVIGSGPAVAIDAGRPLKEYGLDSLMAVELRNLLARSLSTALPATLLFDRPTLLALTDYLMGRLELDVPSASAAPQPDAAVAALSEDEAEAQLLAELSASATDRGAR